MIKIYSTLICIIFYFLSGCGQDKYNEPAIVMPFYQECKEKVTLFRKELKESYEGTNLTLDLRLNYFNYKSKTHPTFIGYIELSGSETTTEMKIAANTIREMCYPVSGSRVSNDEYGLKIINSKLSENINSGIKNNYFKITNEEISIFYNNNDIDVPQLGPPNKIE